jgi:hypothetical protein
LILVAVGACGVLWGPVGVAQASNASIRAAFVAANPHLNADERAVANAVKAYRRDRRAHPVIAALRHEVRDIRALNRVIKGQVASTRRGRRAKADITKGLALIAGAYAALATDIQKAHAGHPVPASRINATVASDRRGRAKLLAGLRLLGLKVKG